MRKAIPILIFLPMLLTGPFADGAAAGELKAGKAKAEAMCRTCHGIDGKATIPMAANLSGQQRQYLVAQLQAYRSGKRNHEQMNIISKMLTDRDIENLAEWYSHIKVTIETPQ